jgi:hypothetical protein
MAYAEPERRIGEVLELLRGKLSDQAASEVREYSESHGEYRLALEELLGAIDDERVAVPPAGLAILRELERAMVPILPDANGILQRLEDGCWSAADPKRTRKKSYL